MGGPAEGTYRRSAGPGQVAVCEVCPGWWAGAELSIFTVFDDVTLVFSGVAAVDKRHRQAFRSCQTGSPFEYDMIRMLYSAKRQIEVKQ